MLLFALLLASLSSGAQTPFDKRSKKTNLPPTPFINTIQKTDGSALNTMQDRPSLMDKALQEFDIRKEAAKRSPAGNPAHARDIAFMFLKQEGVSIDTKFNPDDLRMYESTIDGQGIYHIKFQQVFRGIDVFGAEIFVHLLNGETYAHGNWANIPDNFNTAANISYQASMDAAVRSLQPEWGFKPFTQEEKELLKYEGPESRLIVLMLEERPVLCYDIFIRPNIMERWKVRVNALTGAVIESYNYTCHVDGPRTGTGTDLNGVTRTINSYLIGSTHYLIDATKSMFSLSASILPDDPAGAIWTIDAGTTSGSSFNQVTSASPNFSNPRAVSAHYNAGVAYEYYKNTFNRNSINGTGGTIISVINIADQNGQTMDNAYWNGTFIAYGNGRDIFKPLAGSLDVAGHEMTHGVVEKSANLEYKNQSGAINESMADIFGCMMDRDDWKLGEDIMKPGITSTGALRDMQDPHNGGSSLTDNFYQPKHMTEYYNGTQDNGGVHINSGIPNHAFYLFATAVGKERAEQVYYRTLTVYLTKTSQFKDLRKAVIQSATDLYGTSVAAEAGEAFDAVGIYEPSPGSPIGNNVADLPVNPGQDFILYYDLDPSVSSTLTIAVVSSGSASGQTTRLIKKKPSVVDNGAYCYYVGSDSRIYRLLLDGSKTETLVSDQTIWDNVAVSKDGKRLAAITSNQDTSIYVWDFGKQEWHQFKLYNPTYSGVTSGGVLFADALEWDHTGTRIMYDAKNIINNNAGSDYVYWDVGIMNVWDLESNSWSTGKIEKLFSSLPDNVSIGNAVFSQRSPYIVAFDYVNAATNQYSVVGYNLNTNTSGTIFNGRDLGFPSYSKNDNILLFNAFNTFDEEVVAQAPLATDKINRTGSPTVVVSLAKWGVWYANGTRPLLFGNKDITSFAFLGLDPPVQATISGTTITATVPSTTDLTKLVANFTSSPYSVVKINGIIQTSGVNVNDFTTPVTYTVVAQDGTSKNYTVRVVKSSVSVNIPQKEFLKVYPNPAGGILNIEHKEPVQRIEIYSSTGQLLMEETPVSNSHRLNIGQLEPGAYISFIYTAEGRIPYWFVKQFQ